MKHRFYEGEIFHKRFLPRIHHFTYDYFFLDLDVFELDTLNNLFFGINRIGIMGFFARDHFGSSNQFLDNALALIETKEWEKPHQLRFLTLPRIFNFVFNPISMLLLLDQEGKILHAVAEVHNYNGGRVLYPMSFSSDTPNEYVATAPKSMYVSPFMGYEGTYTFHLEYSPEHFGMRIDLNEGDKQMLIAHFSGSGRTYGLRSLNAMLWNHTFLTLFVVTRTLWQSLRLKLKGLAWYSPRAQDQLKQESI